MARGAPDWGGPKANTGFVLLEDLAELAARLGSVTIEERSGKVFWYDDFRHGIEAWKYVPSGSGSSAEIVTTLPKFSPYCAKLVAGSGGLLKVAFTKHFGVIPTGGIGAEISIMFPDTYFAFDMTIGYGNGAIARLGRLLLVQSTGLLTYQDSDGEYQTIASDIVLDNDMDEYHTLKLVVNFTTNKYVRCMLSGINYTMSGYDLYPEIPASHKFLWFAFHIYSRYGQNDAVHLDGFVMTRDEI